MARDDEERSLIVGVSQRLLLGCKPLLGARALRLRFTYREHARQQQHAKRKGGAYARPHSSRVLRRRLHLNSLLPRASTVGPRLTRHALV